jgi:hypothetical protein
MNEIRGFVHSMAFEMNEYFLSYQSAMKLLWRSSGIVMRLPLIATGAITLHAKVVEFNMLCVFVS